MYTRILALFSAVPYSSPATPGFLGEGINDDRLHALNANLAAHLTNTSLQIERGEAGVRLLDELAGCHIISLERPTDGQSLTGAGCDVLTAEGINDLKAQMADVLAETFKAAVDMSVHFQVRTGSCNQFHDI